MRIDDYSDRVRPVGVFYVDVHPVRWTEEGRLEFLVLRRVTGHAEVPMPGHWQTVSGKLLPDERISAGFRRQTLKKTGQSPRQVFPFRSVAQFFDPNYDTVMLVPNAIAVLEREQIVLDTSLHDDYEWLEADAALQRLIYPTQRYAVERATELLSLGTDGDTQVKPGQVEVTAE